MDYKRSKMLNSNKGSINELLEVLHPSGYTSLWPNEQRFSPLLLEHGEKDLQDWGVVASSSFQTVNGLKSNGNIKRASSGVDRLKSGKFDSRGIDRGTGSNSYYDDTNHHTPPSSRMKRIEGRIHLCSKSIVFDPIDSSRGIIRCPFEKMEAAPHGTTTTGSFEISEVSTEKNQEQTNIVVTITSLRYYIIKTNNIIAPFEVVDIPTEFKFIFLHSSPQEFFQFSNALYSIDQSEGTRATELNKQHGDSKISSNSLSLEDILRPMLNRPFDSSNFQSMTEIPQTNNLRTSLLTPLIHKPGCTIVTTKNIYFQPCYGLSSTTAVAARALFWNLDSIQATARRYNGLKDCALELFFHKKLRKRGEPSVLLAFESSREREQVMRLLERNAATSVQSQYTSSLPCHTDRIFLLRAVRAWRNGNISNFDYLLALNSASGRTMHDLSRYPIFPWVISDYSSSKLEIEVGDNVIHNDSANQTEDSGSCSVEPTRVFRDLTKPIGALNQERLEYFQSRYEDMQDMDNAFFFGTHYSAPGYILYYLVRTMPEHMLCLQNGKYDTPDRLFSSMENSYLSLMTNPADIKESIPQFYDINGGSDFLVNVNGLFLGVTQTGKRINDVELPLWADSPRDFLKQNRAALESDYCTKFLPQWIDLIFGEKSRGLKALKAKNLFHPNAYLASIDLERMQTDQERLHAELHATEFGIVPDMLFSEEHPPKINGNNLQEANDLHDKESRLNESFILPDSGRADIVERNVNHDIDDSRSRNRWEILDSPSRQKRELCKEKTPNDFLPTLPIIDSRNKMTKYASEFDNKNEVISNVNENTINTSGITIRETNFVVDPSNPFDDTSESNEKVDSDTDSITDPPDLDRERSVAVETGECCVDASRPNMLSKHLSLSGTGKSHDDNSKSFIKSGTFNNDIDDRQTSRNFQESSNSSSLQPFQSSQSLENHLGWDLRSVSRKKIHTDAISGCSLLSVNSNYYITTSSLDGGLMVHTIPVSPDSNENVSKRKSFETFSRFSGKKRTLESKTSILHPFRSHMSSDPLACLALASDKSGGIVAFTGGHNDVVLAYGINSACALASVYSHRDAVTGIDIIPIKNGFEGRSDIKCTHIMVSGSWDATVKLWLVSLTEGETVTIDRDPLTEFYDCDSSIISTAVTHIDDYGIAIAAGCSDGTVFVWTCNRNGEQTNLYKEEGGCGNGSCTSLQWMIDPIEAGNFLFVGFGNGRLISYLLSDGVVRLMSKVLVSSPIQCISVCSQKLFVGCTDGGLRLIAIGNRANFDHNPCLFKAVNGIDSPGLTSLNVIEALDISQKHNFMCAVGAEDGSVSLLELKELT